MSMDYMHEMVVPKPLRKSQMEYTYVKRRIEGTGENKEDTIEIYVYIADKLLYV